MLNLNCNTKVSQCTGELAIEVVIGLHKRGQTGIYRVIYIGSYI